MKIKSSLRTKMIVIIAVLTAVLLSFEGIVSLTITQKAYKRTLKGSYENEADYVLAKVDGWLLEYQSLMASAQSVVSASTSAEDVVKLQKVLVDLNGNNEDVEMVYIVFNNGVIVAGNGWVQPTGFSDLDSDFYRRAIAADGAFITTAPYMSNKTLVDQGAIITMARHFKLNNWEGVVAIDINLDKFKAKVDKLIEESGEEGDYAILAVTDILDSKKIVDGETIYSKYLNEKDMDDPDARSITTLDGGVYLKALEFDPVENTNFYKDRNGTSVCVTGAKNTSTGWEVLYVSPSTHYTKQVNSNKNQVFVVFIICVLVAIAVSAVVGIMIAKPIVDASKKVNKLSEDIASGTADLTVSIDTRSKDELGVLVYGINNLLKALGMMMSDIYGASKTLTDNVKNLKSAARSTSDNVATISATMEEMSASSEETSASTSQVTQQINDITGLTTKVSGDTAEKTKEIDTDIKKVDVLRGKIETNDANMMKRLNTAIEALQEKIKATKKVEDIQKMTEGISDVASQTNLLSLNASIEAARAGEMGKGFAVVADEIGKLANNSAGMARNIQEVSDEVLAIVEELVKSAEEVSDIMLKIAKENSEEKTNLIDEYISTLNGCYDSMASISESNVEIAQAIGMISDSIKAIDIAVEENAQGITSVAEGAAVLVTVSDDVMNGANEIGDITDDLSAKVSGYKF